MTGNHGGINIKMSDIFNTDKKIVLNVGCGKVDLKEHSIFLTTPEWKEVRVDAWEGNDTAHVYSDITNLKGVPDESCDAIWACHVVEHVYFHQLPDVFNSMMRVLKKDGFAVIRVPNLGCLADKIKNGLLTHQMYESSSGPITVIDMIYGHRGLIQEWGEGMAHKTGFTLDSMNQILTSLNIKAYTKDTEFNEVIALLYKDKAPDDYMKAGTF